MVQSPPQLGWEFRFLVPISGTPIGSGIPILFQIPGILVRFYFKILLLKSHPIGIPICKIRNPGNLFMYKLSTSHFEAIMY